MKLNISCPQNGTNMCLLVDDEQKLKHFYDKRMSQEITADHLGIDWKDYVFRITGGNDKQGFPMKQGVLTNGRVKLLLKKGHSCYRPRRTGERKRKSVRGCIVDANLSVLSLAIVKQGPTEIADLTDKTKPRRLGPKRASKLRKLFNLSKDDDVRNYVIRRKYENKNEKAVVQAPKIQRLVTPIVLQRKRHRMSLKKRHSDSAIKDRAVYAKLLAKRQKEAKHRRESSRRRSTLRDSVSAHPEKPVKPSSKAKPVTKPAVVKTAPKKK